MRSLEQYRVLFCYDGTLEGFFSVVFHAFASKCRPGGIAESSMAQPELGQPVQDISTNMAHAERVRVGLATRCGAQCYEKVKKAFLSCAQGRELVLLDYIVYAMEVGHRVQDAQAHMVVAQVEKLARSVELECEKMQQFVRFQELEGGVFFARINPKCNVLPLVMGYFSGRYNAQPFLIYDEVHHIAGVYNTQHYTLVLTDSIDIPNISEGEREYQRLWKTFYDSVCGEQRYNPGLRQRFIPLRLRKNLTEFQLAI